MKTKEELSKELNRELASTLARYETIFNYYKENPDRLNIYYEALNKKTVIKQGNIPCVLDLCNDYYKINPAFNKKYGINLGNFRTGYIENKISKESEEKFVLFNNEGLNVESDLIKKLSFLGRDVVSLREEINKRSKK